MMRQTPSCFQKMSKRLKLCLVLFIVANRRASAVLLSHVEFSTCENAHFRR